MSDSLPFDPANEPYVNLATFRRNGASVRTPVWIAEHGDTLYVFSANNAGKVKRLRNDTRIQLAACDARGNVTGDWIDGEAYLTNDEVEIDAMYPSFIQKYGWQMKVGNFFSRLTGRYSNRQIIGIKRNLLTYR